MAPWVTETARPGFHAGAFLWRPPEEARVTRATTVETSVTAWDKYIDYAERCLALARATGSRESRIALRQMASRWTKLASALDQEERPIA